MPGDVIRHCRGDIGIVQRRVLGDLTLRMTADAIRFQQGAHVALISRLTIDAHYGRGILAVIVVMPVAMRQCHASG